MSAPYRWVVPPDDYPGHRYQPSNRVLEHHLVWWQTTGQVIPPGFVVHHKDNCGLHNSFDNLELLNSSEHTRMHQGGAGGVLFLTCSYCGCDISRSKRDVRSKNRQGQQRFFCCARHAALIGKSVLSKRTEPIHGTSTAYAGGCRCGECRAYNSERQRRQKEKRKGRHANGGEEVLQAT